ncbi:uncharacterized protein LOC122063230 [Macadamia integrifolia]|uniref:uncharacterized protein LOC122063230 n=1 Tax=Macadamia integrifolia TaxID=60698 RepID=UPI001C4E834F|nr:uncharacterized protein LOC122063230 [Macadamia integrifolia]
MDTLRSKVTSAWALKEELILKSLGKGFVLFRFQSETDMLNIWKRGPVRVEGQLLRFQRWRPEFKVEDEDITHRLAWVRFPNHPQEYWDEEILLTMAKAVGRPVAIDRRMKDSHYDHFAGIYIDLDDSQPWVEEIYVEREHASSSDIFLFKQVVKYENPLSRCVHCRRFGHRPDECPIMRRDNEPEGMVPGENYADARPPVVRRRREWRPLEVRSEMAAPSNLEAEVAGTSLGDPIVMDSFPDRMGDYNDLNPSETRSPAVLRVDEGILNQLPKDGPIVSIFLSYVPLVDGSQSNGQADLESGSGPDSSDDESGSYVQNEGTGIIHHELSEPQMGEEESYSEIPFTTLTRKKPEREDEDRS